MTTLQKSIMVAALAIAAGTGIYAARQNAELQARIQAFSRQQGPLMAQLYALQQDYAAATNELVALQAENEQWESGSNEMELLRLRGEVTRLENQKQSGEAAAGNDPFVQSVIALAARAEALKSLLQQMPNKKIPEMQLLNDDDWLAVAQDAQLDSDRGIRKAFQKLRSIAKDKLPIGQSLSSYASDDNGQLPDNLSELETDIRFRLQSKGISLDDGTVNVILDRYKLLHTGKAGDFPSGTWLVVEKAPVDEEYDSREKFGLGTASNFPTGLGESGDPDDPGY